MYKKLFQLSLTVFLIFSAFVTVYATDSSNTETIVSLEGDKDNFYREADDGTFDQVIDGCSAVWYHRFTPINGEIISSRLELGTRGIEDSYYTDRDLQLFIDDIEVPKAFDNITSISGIVVNFPLASSFFDVLKDGSVKVEIKQGGPSKDCYEIDYSELVINYEKKDIPVTIDIKPGSDPSSFGVNSKGKIPVALLGSATFDVTQVNDSTVRFGDSEGSGAYSSINVGLEDTNGDGYLDKVYHFSFPETNLDSSDTLGYLSGQLFNGSTFVASSDVNIVGPNATVAEDEEVIEVEDDGMKMKVKVKKP
jgi:hypothetical protein